MLVTEIKAIRKQLQELDHYEAEIKEDRKELKKREKAIIKILNNNELLELEHIDESGEESTENSTENVANGENECYN